MTTEQEQIEILKKELGLNNSKEAETSCDTGCNYAFLPMTLQENIQHHINRKKNEVLQLYILKAMLPSSPSVEQAQAVMSILQKNNVG